MSGDIYPWLFQSGHFHRPLVLHIFLHCLLNTKLTKSHPDAMSQNCPHNVLTQT